MPTVSAKVSKKELNAIQEYANACGETVSNLIRKAVIRDVTFLDGFEDAKEYNYDISIPDNASSEQETETVKGCFNRCRRILGIEEIKEL